MFNFLNHIANKLTYEHEIIITTEQLEHWEDTTIQLLIEYEILMPSENARTVRCDECWKRCSVDVEYDMISKPYATCVDNGTTEATIPIESDQIRQFSVSYESLSIAIAKLLNLSPERVSYESDKNRYFIGRLKGKNQSARLYLIISEKELMLLLGDEKLSLLDYLFVRKGKLTINYRKLKDFIEKNPRSVRESSHERRIKVLKITQVLKSRNVKNNVQALAEITSETHNNTKRILSDARNKEKQGKIKSSEIASMELDDLTLEKIEKAISKYGHIK